MRKLILMQLCSYLMFNLSACSTNEQVLETAHLPKPPSQVFADEVFMYDSEDEFVQAYTDPHGGIAKMDYTLPDFYLRPVNLPEELKFKWVYLEPYGYTWRYMAPEGTAVWVSATHEHFSKAGTLEGEVKATLSIKYDLIKKITVDGRDFMYLDALDVGLGFTLINFMEHDTLVGVLVVGYCFSEDMIKKYCNVEAVPISNTVREKR